MSCQVVVPSSSIAGGLEIGSDDDEGPEQPMASPTSTEGGPNLTSAPRAAMWTPKPSMGARLKKAARSTTAGASEAKKVPAPSLLGWSRRGRPNHREVLIINVSLPPSKRHRSKSRSPPLVVGAGVSQPERPEGVEHEIPPRSSDQVPIRNIFYWLIGVFAHMDSLERVREVCTQEKASTPPVSKPIGQRAKKLKCSIPLDP